MCIRQVLQDQTAAALLIVEPDLLLKRKKQANPSAGVLKIFFISIWKIVEPEKLFPIQPFFSDWQKPGVAGKEHLRPRDRSYSYL